MNWGAVSVIAVQRLGGLDSAFLYLETPTSHLHVAWAAVLDTRRQPDAASLRRICDLIGARLHLLPALRKRLADPRLGYTQPDWIDVDVDPTDHCAVHRSEDLQAVAADVLGRALDRRRPLWELHIVEGLPAGRTGMIMKLHHAVLDGPSGAELMVQLLDAQPKPRHPRRVAARSPSTLNHLVSSWSGSPGGGPAGGGRAATQMRNALDVWAAVRQWDLDHPDDRRARHVRCPAHAAEPADQCPAGDQRHGNMLDALDKIRRDTGLDGERRGAGHRRWRLTPLPHP